MSNAFGSPFPKIQIMKIMNIQTERIIESLKTSHTQGYDEISINILKTCTTYISTHLNYLSNGVSFEGIFPDRLKYATIVLVYKKGDRNILTNHGPISILTSFNKIFDKVMYDMLIKHLNKNNILSNHQFGFRWNQGTDNAIF
jgi:Notch-like protein